MCCIIFIGLSHHAWLLLFNFTDHSYSLKKLFVWDFVHFPLFRVCYMELLSFGGAMLPCVLIFLVFLHWGLCIWASRLWEALMNAVVELSCCFSGIHSHAQDTRAWSPSPFRSKTSWAAFTIEVSLCVLGATAGHRELYRLVLGRFSLAPQTLQFCFQKQQTSKPQSDPWMHQRAGGTKRHWALHWLGETEGPRHSACQTQCF
jgi:hypothetical protein